MEGNLAPIFWGITHTPWVEQRGLCKCTTAGGPGLLSQCLCFSGSLQQRKLVPWANPWLHQGLHGLPHCASSVREARGGTVNTQGDSSSCELLPLPPHRRLSGGGSEKAGIHTHSGGPPRAVWAQGSAADTPVVQVHQLG